MASAPRPSVSQWALPSEYAVNSKEIEALRKIAMMDGMAVAINVVCNEWPDAASTLVKKWKEMAQETSDAIDNARRSEKEP